MVGGNAALWLRLDNLSGRGGGGPRDRLELARRVAGCDILRGMGRSSSSMSGVIFRPLMSIDIAGLGTATTLEAVGTTQNMKGEKMLDKMSAHCAALNVASGDKKYIDGACVLADSDGDKIFSTFDTRDLDKSQPKMDCGTHIITGGTGKYKGITGSEPFACITMPALAGPGGYFAMDIPHNTTWEIK